MYTVRQISRMLRNGIQKEMTVSHFLKNYLKIIREDLKFQTQQIDGIAHVLSLGLMKILL